jgi:diguanylate cyclase (GGDEF)-like protein
MRLLAKYEASGKGWFWETRADGSIAYLSPKISQVMANDGIYPTSLTELVGSDVDVAERASERSLSFYIASRLPFESLVLKARGQGELWWSLTGEPSHDAAGRFQGFVGFAIDLTDQKNSEIKLLQLARFDSLTNLANRNTIRQALENSIASSAMRRHRCATMILDLDRFKLVNDTFGHPVGDQLLKLVAERLLKVVGGRGQVGRLGGDEFQIVFADLCDAAILSTIAADIIHHLSQPYLIQSHLVSIGTSIGIATSDYDRRSAIDLVRDADLALYSAKADGKGTYRFFASDMHEQARLRQQIEEDMQRALERGEFTLAYQPVVTTNSGALVGFEALVRWTHPIRGAVSPATFIPIAEEAGLITELGDWVLRTACLEAVKWPEHISVAVNISPIQFSSQSLPSLVASALAYAGLAADRLELEITEGALLNDTAKTRSAIQSLKALGVKISLDDFGTGYSSLGYLKTIPFDKIKIDQSFVKGATLPGNNNVPIIKAIVGLAADLGMITTAEGVETEDQLALVTALGCTLIQGYIYGRPLDPPSALVRATGEQSQTNGFKSERAERLRIIRAGQIVARTARENIRLRNISCTGAMIETGLDLNIGELVSLDIGLPHPLEADVRWIKDGRAGLRFAHLISLEEVLLAKPSASVKAFVPTYLSLESNDLFADKKRLNPKDFTSR